MLAKLRAQWLLTARKWPCQDVADHLRKARAATRAAAQSRIRPSWRWRAHCAAAISTLMNPKATPALAPGS